MVDVKIFSKREAMLASLTETIEAFKTSQPLSEAYVAMHEAWQGIPKIYVSAEDFERIPSTIFDVALRHEVAHSALHGSPEYYILNIPSQLAEEFRKQGFTDYEGETLAYLEAVALKDFEASELLKKLGFIEDQAAFILYSFRMDEAERATWKLASINSKAWRFLKMQKFCPA